MHATGPAVPRETTQFGQQEESPSMTVGTDTRAVTEEQILGGLQPVSHGAAAVEEADPALLLAALAAWRGIPGASFVIGEAVEDDVAQLLREQGGFQKDCQNVRRTRAPEE